MTSPSPQRSVVPPVVTTLMVATGRMLMTGGVLVLAFAAFQLWGTGFSEARAQADLEARFEEQLALAAVIGSGDEAQSAQTETRTGSAGAPSAGTGSVVEAARVLVVEVPGPEQPDRSAPVGLSTAEPTPRPELGQPIGVLDIPAIGVRKTVAEGTGRDVLRSGPGHYPSTPLPGERGNVSIAGHRTTHGAPFLDIDQLEPGDEISFETVDGMFVYAVEAQVDKDGIERGHHIVAPEAVEVITDRGDNRLTLTACHPKYSARQRIVVTAVLVSGPAPNSTEPAVTEPLEIAAPTQAAPPHHVAAVPVSLAQEKPAEPLINAVLVDTGLVDTGPMVAGETLGWQSGHAGPTAWWASVTAAMAMAAWTVGRMWRRVPTYAMAVPPMTLSLYYCFVNLERFIPAV